MMLIKNYLTTLGCYLQLMGRTFTKPDRFRMFMRQYVKEMAQLGVDSIGIVLLISFFIGAVICWIWVSRMAKREFGAISGDISGFFVQICEMCMLALLVLGQKVVII